ncbi:MAG: hypothetical protein KJO72_01410 [Gammaproteobacteria bacterium]|nr:hypothetical protein [Gammaproteobacteria bacterium]
MASRTGLFSGSELDDLTQDEAWTAESVTAERTLTDAIQDSRAAVLRVLADLE